MKRRGFTLVEILTVMSIIALMMSIGYPLVGGFISMARHKATESTMAKVQNLLVTRQQAFARLIQRRGWLKQSAEWMLVHNSKLPFFTSLSADQKKIITVKILEMRYFPQCRDDLEFLWNFYRVNDPVADWTTSQLQQMYPKFFNADGTVVSGLTNQEILYGIVSDSSLGDSPVGLDSFISTEIGYNTQGLGLPFFVDAWRNPIVFYHWPTRLFRGDGITISDADVLNTKVAFTSLPLFTGNLKTDLARDPGDPMGAMAMIPGFETIWHTPATYHLPLLVSAGPDGDIGMGRPDSSDFIERLGIVKNQDAFNDNLFSASTKVGSK